MGANSVHLTREAENIAGKDFLLSQERPTNTQNQCKQSGEE